MAFFFCLSSMAQVVLGDINFSLKEGGKINPATGTITVTFPNVTGVADPAATNFVLAGSFAEGLSLHAEDRLCEGGWYGTGSR